MNLRNILARRRMEKRIERKAKLLSPKPKRRGPSPLEVTAERMLEKGVRIGRRMYVESQARKAEGKRIVEGYVKRILFGTRREARYILTGSYEKKRRRK